jgi:hypothetical protein
MGSVLMELDPEPARIGTLIGLLDATGELNKEWFSDPWTNLLHIPRRITDFLKLLDVALGPASDIGPAVFTDAQWYPIRNPLGGAETSFCLVTPKSTPSMKSGVIGGGVLQSLSYEDLTVIAYGYLPLFELSTTADPKFVVTKETTHIGLRVTSSSAFSGIDHHGKTFKFTAVVLEAQFVLSAPPVPQSLNLQFTDLTIDGALAPKESTYASLQAVIANVDAIVEWIAAVVLQGTYWLNTYVGRSSYTVGDLLKFAKILQIVATGSPPNTTEKYELNAQYLKDTQAVQIAEQFFIALLSSLSQSEEPLVPVPGGGIYVVEESDETGVKHYGARLVVTDLPISGGQKEEPSEAEGSRGSRNGGAKGKPEVLLQIGKWMEGEDEANSWVARSLSKHDPAPQPKPGISAYLLSHDGHTSKFDPYYEFISLGLDIRGGDQQPLFNINDYVLSGGELRTYITERNGTFSFGAAASLDGLGVPLGPSFGEAVPGSQTNPVAQSLLESGSKSDGGGEKKSGDAINPAFGFSLGFVQNGEVVAQLYDKDGKPADVVVIPIQRAVGPLQCEKLGIGWVQEERLVSLLFDGGVKAGTLDLDLVGLSIGVPITSPADYSKYQLGLDGLGIDFKSGQVELSAAFARVKGKDYVEYDGEALLKAGNFTLSAFGSYAYVKADSSGYASLFIFAMLDAILGDPTETGACLITGIAAGFGYNRTLMLPQQDGVPDFPLVAAASDPSVLGGEGVGPAEALEKLGSVVLPERGESWLAAGIRFTSFDLINSTALVVVEFGNELEIALLGLSWISLPMPAAPGAEAPAKKFAYGELGIEIKILPAEGVVTATAILTPNSFVLDPACKLTGGFAFYVWFGSNPYAGQFVLTLGGYHPDFKPPSYFPQVPRLAFNWPMPGDVTISGDAYFALTASAVMAGGGLQVLFDRGALRAWFKAEINVIIQWAPFHYNAEMGVTIGVWVRVDIWFITFTINVELEADLTLVGPPMGGVAHVHFYIVSFTVKFGSQDDAAPPPLEWTSNDGTGFSQTLLPHQAVGRSLEAMAAYVGPTPVVVASGVYTISVNDGLMRTHKKNNETIWVVRGNHFVFSAVTNVPCTEVVLTESKTTGTQAKTSYSPLDCPHPDPYTEVYVRPMKATLSASVLTITLTATKSGQTYDLPGEFDVEVASAAVPEAKWGPPLASNEDPNYNKQLPSRLLGLKNIRVKAPTLTPSGDATLDIYVRKAFTYVVVDEEVPYHPFHLPLKTAAGPIGTVPQVKDSLSTIKSSLMSASAVAARGSILTLLQQYGVDPVTNGDLKWLAIDPAMYLNGNPLLAGSA